MGIIPEMTRKMDNLEELLPVTDEEGNVTGSISRKTAHDGSKILHPVVHLHVFNSNGELYLQKRPEWKDIQPGKWDTATGGHVEYGESIKEALFREVMEEIGIKDFVPEKLGHYIFESERERELVNVFKTIYDHSIYPNINELDGGRFWNHDEIHKNIGKGIFTPNFENEYAKFFNK